MNEALDSQESMLDATLRRTQDDGLGHGSLTAQTGNALDLVGELVAVNYVPKRYLESPGLVI